jgi:hypothetical protein
MKTHRVRCSLGLAGCTIGLMAATACAAQTPDTTAQKPGASKTAPDSSKPDKPGANGNVEVKLRRLESITWNPVTQELTWVLSTGELNSNGYSPTKKQSYVMRMDAATMSVQGEARHFDPEEADQVGKVMDLICRYALESTLWWEHGGGEKLDQSPGTKTTDPVTNGPANKDRVDTDKSRKVPPGMLRGSAPLPAGAIQSTAAVMAPGRQ